MAIHEGVTESRDLRRSWLRRALLVAGLVIGSWLALTLSGGTAGASPEVHPGASERDVPGLVRSTAGDITAPLGRALGHSAEESPVEPVADAVLEPGVAPVLNEVVEPVVAPVLNEVVEPVVAPVVNEVVEPVVAPLVNEVVEPVLKPVVNEVVEPVVAPVLNKVVEPTVVPVLSTVVTPAPVVDMPIPTEPALAEPVASKPTPTRAGSTEPPAGQAVTEGTSVIAPSRSSGVPDDRPYGEPPFTPASAPTSSTGVTTGGPGQMVTQPLFSSAPYVPTARGPITATPAGELADGARPEPSLSPD